MTKKIFSCGLLGLNTFLVEVEAYLSTGLPLFTIVGLGDASIQESKERVRASIKNSGYAFPQSRKTINLAPAELKKQGSLYDFPIAVALLSASDQIDSSMLVESVFVGELSLAGKLKPISGALAICEFVSKKKFKRIFLPKDNFEEASLILDLEIIAIDSLNDFVEYTKDPKIYIPPEKARLDYSKNKHEEPDPFSSIAGHDFAKRALCIVASGSHSLLFDGPPGCGKTLLARALTKILPALTNEEMLLSTKIFSIAGKLNPKTPVVINRPFREVNPTASLPSIVGGGASHPKPGEITLAHNGVLYLDEIPEFPRKSIESLRQPFEDRYIIINRSNFSLCFPSNFILLASKNPCPCGYYGTKKKKCICTDTQVKNYQKRLSGPIIDRFDMYLQLEDQSIHKNILDFEKEEKSSPPDYRSLVKNAIDMQKKRFINEKNIKKNSEMTLYHIKKFCKFSETALDTLKTATEKLNLSSRAYLKTIRLSRTIADLSLSEIISENHIAESLQYRYREF